jgi:hypothetical protein
VSFRAEGRRPGRCHSEPFDFAQGELLRGIAIVRIEGPALTAASARALHAEARSRGELGGRDARAGAPFPAIHDPKVIFWLRRMESPPRAVLRVLAASA